MSEVGFVKVLGLIGRRTPKGETQRLSNEKVKEQKEL